MKIFSFILSFFLLFISCLPCGDMQECTTQVEQAVTAAVDHQNHQHGAEACTPFCYCTCCAASVISQNDTGLQATKPLFHPDEHTVLNDFFLSQNLSNIWQPPKITG